MQTNAVSIKLTSTWHLDRQNKTNLTTNLSLIMDCVIVCRT